MSCIVCLLPLGSHSKLILNNYYHANCFKCQRCGKSIQGDWYYIKDSDSHNYFYCDKCTDLYHLDAVKEVLSCSVNYSNVKPVKNDKDKCVVCSLPFSTNTKALKDANNKTFLFHPLCLKCNKCSNLLDVKNSHLVHYNGKIQTYCANCVNKTPELYHRVFTNVDTKVQLPWTAGVGYQQQSSEKDRGNSSQPALFMKQKLKNNPNLPKSVNFCPDCGTAVSSSSAKFCDDCGFPLK